MTLTEVLQQGHPLLLDGAMGTLLEQRGQKLSSAVCNIEAPEAVQQIHQDYLAAGSDLLVTNTLCLNRIYAEMQHFPYDVNEAIQNAVLAAKQAVAKQKPQAFVLGNIGSTGQMLAPYGPGNPAAFSAAFEEEAAALAAAGVDGLIAETIFDLQEALLAVQACRKVSKLPVLASMTFSTANRGGRTMMGNKAADCARQLQEAGCAAVGLNCGDVDIADLAKIVVSMKEAVTIPILVEPNAGKPQVENGKTVYHLPPEEFSAKVAECWAAGASILGGCCGTAPEYIAALAKLLGRG